MSSQQEPEQTIQIGNYTIMKTIGSGTFGKVKLGIHNPTQEKVAIKILEKDKITEQADVERIKREINILKIMRHPHIIQLYEILETPSQIYLIMEYASRGELFDYIVANERLSQKESCKFFQQIVNGIEYLHKQGIVHRDLKPENLLLDECLNLKIVDFGLSNTYNIAMSGPQLITACGSPCYAAPEMISGHRYEGAKVDIWSLGIILYALLCGYLPFDDPNTAILYKKIQIGVYEIPQWVTNEAREMLTGILCVDPNKRFAFNDIKKQRFWKCINQQFTNDGPVVVGKDTIALNEQIIDIVANKNQVPPQLIKQQLLNNFHNENTSMYQIQNLNFIKLKSLQEQQFQETSVEKHLFKKVMTSNTKENYQAMATTPQQKQQIEFNDEIQINRNLNNELINMSIQNQTQKKTSQNNSILNANQDKQSQKNVKNERGQNSITTSKKTISNEIQLFSTHSTSSQLNNDSNQLNSPTHLLQQIKKKKERVLQDNDKRNNQQKKDLPEQGEKTYMKIQEILQKEQIVDHNKKEEINQNLLEKENQLQKDKGKVCKFREKQKNIQLEEQIIDFGSFTNFINSPINNGNITTTGIMKTENQTFLFTHHEKTKRCKPNVEKVYGANVNYIVSPKYKNSLLVNTINQKQQTNISSKKQKNYQCARQSLDNQDCFRYQISKLNSGKQNENSVLEKKIQNKDHNNVNQEEKQMVTSLQECNLLKFSKPNDCQNLKFEKENCEQLLQSHKNSIQKQNMTQESVLKNEIAIYEGPFHMNSIIMKDPLQIMLELKQILKLALIIQYILQEYLFKLSCQINEIKLEIQIKQFAVEASFYILTFSQFTGQFDNYSTITRKILYCVDKVLK